MRRCTTLQEHVNKSKLASLFFLGNTLTVNEVKDPMLHQLWIYYEPKLPILEVPYIPFHSDLELPTLKYSNEDSIIGDLITTEGIFASSLIKKRKKKMNKHKYKKRIDRDIAKIRKIRGFRLKKKRRRQAHKKAILVKKLDKVLKSNPKSDLPNRPYVMYRLKNW